MGDITCAVACKVFSTIAFNPLCLYMYIMRLGLGGSVAHGPELPDWCFSVISNTFGTARLASNLSSGQDMTGVPNTLKSDSAPVAGSASADRTKNLSQVFLIDSSNAQRMAACKTTTVSSAPALWSYPR